MLWQRPRDVCTLSRNEVRVQNLESIIWNLDSRSTFFNVFKLGSYSKYKIAGSPVLYNVLYPDMRFGKQPFKVSPTIFGACQQNPFD